MTEHRRYTKQQKATAVMAAEMSNAEAVSQVQGIPANTIRYWMDRPEFVELRTKTRDDLRAGMELLAHAAQSQLMARIKEMEPRDLTILLGVATDKSQLLSGAATSRTETRRVTDDLDDHEKSVLRDVIDRAVAESAEAGAGSDPGGTGPAVRE